MKKLLTLCLLVATAFTVNAQQKPTKEETVAYLDKVVKMTIGYKQYGVIGYGESEKRVTEKLITTCLFSPSMFEIHWVTHRLVGDTKEYDESDKFSNLKWENLDKIEYDIEKKSLSLPAELVYINFSFSTKIRWDAWAYGSETGMEEATHYTQPLFFAVLKTKADSFKKGIERLVEIAKEENKDPFGR